MSDMRADLIDLIQEHQYCDIDVIADAILAKYPPAPAVTGEQAWDDGYEAGRDDAEQEWRTPIDYREAGPCRNPYRAAVLIVTAEATEC